MIERIRLAEHLPEPLSHYTDAVRAGEMLWVSGLLGVDRGGTVVGDGVHAQAEQVFRNLDAVLHHVGVGPDAVVKVTVYLRRIDDRAAVNEARQAWFGTARPASTLVEVSALALPDALVEVDAVAYLGAR